MNDDGNDDAVSQSAVPHPAAWLQAARRPPGATDETVEALGKISEALETTERARGSLYDFHQLTGHADRQFSDGADLLEAAGHTSEADVLRREIVGRNVIEGRWTFQVIEEYDATYWTAVRRLEAELRGRLLAGMQHVHESEMKDASRSVGVRHHELRPRPGE